MKTLHTVLTVFTGYFGKGVGNYFHNEEKV